VEGKQMTENNDNTFILVKNSKGVRFICPINSVGNSQPERLDEIDDCVEEDVIGRYAGNIKIKPS
jgi:hypothetical protein